MTRASLEQTVSQAPGAGSITSEQTHLAREDEVKTDVEQPAIEDVGTGLEQGDGVTKIEALYLVFGKGWKLLFLWGSIGLVCYVYALSESTTYTYAAFATSAFGEHTIVGTIAVITAIMAGVAQPFIAKCSDLFSRPMALAVSVFFYTIGYIVVASAQNVDTVVGGQVIYTLGNTGINQVSGILIADITSLQWRGAVQGAYSLPFVVNAFVAGYITDGIDAYSENGWRWGYGMFCILVPVCIAPSLLVLFWADRRAKRLGALSLASSSYARRQILEGIEAPRRTFVQNVLHYWSQIDAFGLLLLGFAFGCLLSPFTLSTTAAGGYTNPSLIALLVVGGILFIAFVAWEAKYAAHPIMPRRVLNRTFLCCVAIDFLYYFSGYLSDTYFSSWVYIVKSEWSARDYTYFSNIETVGLCGFAVFAGLIQRYTHRYKALQLAGLSIRIIGMGLNFLGANGNYKDVTLIMSRILISLGGAISVTSTQVASQGSVPHADMALAMSILSLWTSLGGSIASGISAAVWDKKVPANLEKYLGEYYNSTELADIFGSIIVARDSDHHDLIIQAYNDSVWGLYLGALIVSILALGAGLLTKEFHLGAAHNTIEVAKEVKFRSAEETADDVVAAKAREIEEKIKEEIVTGQ